MSPTACAAFFGDVTGLTRLDRPRRLYILWLDYGNATLAGLPANLIRRLQSVLNAAARLVFSLRKYDRVTPLLQQLHWLKVDQRIQHIHCKLAVLVFLCLHGLATQYLANDLQRVSDLDARRRLRSASTCALVITSTRLFTVGDRAFPVDATRTWNSLTDSVTSSPSLPAFKRRLKTILFARSYNR